MRVRVKEIKRCIIICTIVGISLLPGYPANVSSRPRDKETLDTKRKWRKKEGESERAREREREREREMKRETERDR